MKKLHLTDIERIMKARALFNKQLKVNQDKYKTRLQVNIHEEYSKAFV